MTSLTLSLTVVMLIALYVKDDLSFDRFHQNGKNLFRLVQDRLEGENEISRMGNTGYPQGPAFKKEIPEFLDYCRMKNGWNTLVKSGDGGIKEKLMYVDNSFFSMFSFKTIAGNKLGALSDLKNVVITEEVAAKYFGNEDPIGKKLDIGDEASAFKSFIVSAVVKSPPSNSSIQFDLLLSFEHMISSDPNQRANDENWFNAGLNTFVLLNANSNAEQLQYKLDEVTSKYTASLIEDYKKRNPQRKEIAMKYHLQPFYDMHLDPMYYATNGMEYWSDALYPKILSGLALLILLIACINFINLTLARSLKRTKEIGIRKASGGTRTQLFSQFISESLLICSITFLPAILLANWLLPTFSQLTDKYLDQSFLFQSETLLLFFVLLILVAIIAGFYPSIILSGFHPIDSIKGKFKTMNRNQLSKALVITQFTIAGILIFCTTVAIRQFEYITSTELGYQTKDRLRFWLPWNEISKVAPALKNDLSQMPYVKQVSSKSGDWNSTKLNINGQQTEYIYYEHIDDNHLQLMGIPLVSGRYFSNAFTTDTVSNIIVNESFVNTYFPNGQDPYKANIRTQAGHMQIIGIVKDFYYASFKEKIKPIVWFKDDGTQAGCMHVEIDGNYHKEAMAQLMSAYKKHIPYLPIEYQFLDDFRMSKYADDLRWKQILTFTAFLAIFIACIGLFALASFLIEQRTKEIGIRKVLGATVLNISSLVSRNFIFLVFLAILISCPIGYLLMVKWLQDFVYRIEMHWSYFVITGIIAVSIATATISVQAIKAALGNPIDSIRSE